MAATLFVIPGLAGTAIAGGAVAGAAAAPVAAATPCPETAGTAAPHAPQKPEPALSWAPHFAQNAINPCLLPDIVSCGEFVALQFSPSCFRRKEGLFLGQRRFSGVCC